MPSPTPSPYLFACFPLQEYFVNKDTGFPLAGGWVEFFSDEAFTVPKDVYQYSLIGGTWTPVNLGSTLVLSSVGTFQNGNGDDIIPYLFPYTGTVSNPGDLELYFIRVWSGDPNVQGSVLQFTRSGWPPNFGNSSSPTDIFESSNNGITNPEFSIVNFTPDPATGYYSLTGVVTDFDVAPGWTLNKTGAGTVKLKQVIISSVVTSNPSFALEIQADLTSTNVKLKQKLNKSPRVYYGQYLSMGMSAASFTNVSETITVDYIPSGGGTSHQILNGTTANNNTFTLLNGVNNAPVKIEGTGSTSAGNTGYVDIIVNIQPDSTVQLTSLCLVTVQNSTSLVSNIASTNAEQTNAMFWYYKPELEYKPIPSYALGWDFAMNPFQVQGTGAVGPYNITGPGKSFYVADQTILFQNTTNTTTVSQVDNRAIKLQLLNNPSSLALVQYLGPNEAQELLNNPVCSLIRAKSSLSSLVGQIRLYFTKNASLPFLGTDQNNNCYSLVSAVNTTTADPTVGGGGNYGDWAEVPRGQLGAAYFTLSTTKTSFGFSGWDASAVADIDQAKFFAIVVTFAEVAINNYVEIEHISLQKGYIPTAPAALSFGETLTGLQQYYEKSFDVNFVPDSGVYPNYNGSQVAVQQSNIAGGHTYSFSNSFSINYKVTKRTDVAATIYNPFSGTQNEFRAFLQAGAGLFQEDKLYTNFYSATGSQNSTLFQNTAAGAVIDHIGVDPNIYFAWAIYQYVADARYGIV